jgi:hypothetical protein
MNLTTLYHDRGNACEGRRYRAVQSMRSVFEPVLVPVSHLTLSDFNWRDGLAESEASEDS